MSTLGGSSLLLGSSTIPGVATPPEMVELIPKILQACRDFGLDFYPTVVQFLTPDEMSEVAAYGGFPVRFPHWKWGMEYEELQKGFEYGIHRIYELVVNSSPCYIYCLNSNTLVDNVTVVAHATGHNDFFKNNIHFEPTRPSGEYPHNMMDVLANHGTRIRKYISRWGKERVTEFIDYVMRLETLVDPAAAWFKREAKSPIVKDERVYRHPKRLNVPEGHDYMEPWINSPEWRKKENEKIKRRDTADEISVFSEPTKNILGFLRDNAPLKPWQQDIVAILYDEAIYFAPQRATKVLNEGFASYVDSNIMSRQGYVSLGQQPGAGIIEYADHKSRVLGGKYSMNPYKLGYQLLLDIEERWNKGRFGTEYHECKSIREKENWDKELGLGHEKVLEVRKNYDDVSLIREFFTADFCNENEFFEWEKRPNGDYVITNRDPEKIKKKLMMKHMNGGLPDIRLVDPNHRGKGWMLLQHQWDGRPLYEPYARDTLEALYCLWKDKVVLATRNKDGTEELVCVAQGPDSDEPTLWLTREEYENIYS
jgi:stage V sporulation protein R